MKHGLCGFSRNGAGAMVRLFALLAALLTSIPAFAQPIPLVAAGIAPGTPLTGASVTPTGAPSTLTLVRPRVRPDDRYRRPDAASVQPRGQWHGWDLYIGHDGHMHSSYHDEWCDRHDRSKRVELQSIRLDDTGRRPGANEYVCHYSHYRRNHSKWRCGSF